MKMNLTAAALLALTAAASPGEAGELGGSRASMIEQNGVARANDLTFVRTGADVERLVRQRVLVKLEGNADYRLNRVSFPFARPEVRTFVERLSAQYRQATGEALVVTSLTRPTTRQPRNSHPLSVHPAGMAIDLRVPASAKARSWLNAALLGMEDRGLLDATREHYPPHYHVAVYPEAYSAYLEVRLAEEATDRAELADRLTREARQAAADAPVARFASAANASVSPADDEAGGWIAAAGVLLILGAIGVSGLQARREDWPRTD